jgi:LysM repeat protein
VKELNLHFMRDRTPPNRGSAVRIPAGTRVAFEAAFPEIHRALRVAQASPAPRQTATAGSTSAPGARTAAARASAGSRTHRVRSGETLTHISRRYGVSVAAIRSANGNIDPRRLRAGQSLRIPGGSGSSVARASSGTVRYHNVRRGENLSVIARQHGVSVRQIQSWNELRGSRIQPGQRLRVRA